jgi:hypothetical protein
LLPLSNTCAPAKEPAACAHSPHFARLLCRLIAGYLLGFLLAAPYILPVLDYSRSGSRLAHRGAGEEERPPVGLAALPEVVLPDLYGCSHYGSYPIYPARQPNLMESATGAYAGAITTLFAAPLAFCRRRRNNNHWFFLFLAVFGLCWCLNLPGLVQLLRLPGLNLLSHNRMVFLTAFALLALAATGLDALHQGAIPWRRWLWAPASLALGLGCWCGYRVFFPPEEIDTMVEQGIARGGQLEWIHDLDDVRRLQFWFAEHYAVSALICGLAAAAWWLLRRTPRSVGKPSTLNSCLRSEATSRFIGKLSTLFIGASMFAELLWFAHGRSVQCDPALYYPPLPALEQLAQAPPGRIIGYDCFPAILPTLFGWRDVRGYDGVDPTRMVTLEEMAREPRTTTPHYARTQRLIPQTTQTADGGIRLAPLWDLLGVRYVIYRGTPPPDLHSAFTGPDYYVMLNPAALPRAFVPKRIEVITNDQQRLEKLASPGFVPADVAYVESPLALPAVSRGTVELRREIPTRIELALRMETPGLVVLANRWDHGWRARLNGQPVPILPVDHVLHGVVLPAGPGTLEFRYAPASFAWGVRLFLTALAAMLMWAALAVVVGRKSEK